MSDHGGSPPPQWAPDPTGRHRFRWWDGAQWTGHVADGAEPPRRTPPPAPGAGPEHAAAQPHETEPGAATVGGYGAAATTGYGAVAEHEEEEAGEHEGRRGRFGGGPGDTRRSFLLGMLVGAVVAGIIAGAAVVLLGGDDTGVSTTSTTKKETTTSAAVSTTTLLTTTTIAGRPPAEVRVVVQNGSGMSGAADSTRTTLQQKGYNVVGIGNAVAREGTLVACKAGFEPDAAPLAAAVGGNAMAGAFPDPPPGGTDDADCVVILGS